MATTLDIITATLGLIYILLELRASIWMWAVGFLMQALDIVLYYDKGLYADCGMELYYLTMTVYGFFVWRRGGIRSGKGEAKPPQPITHIPCRVAIRWALTAAALWVGIYVLLVTLTDSSVPLADSFTTALSMAGIWALARKYVEQWFIWIAVDVVTSALYFHKDIPFKASLYALYVVIAVFGYRKWRQMISKKPC